MNDTEKAILLMCISLPVMFIVMAAFVFLTKTLHKAFPAEEE